MQGRIQPKVDGGSNLERGTNSVSKSKRAEGTRKFLEHYSRKLSGFDTA